MITTVLCCVVYDSCAQGYAHICEQFLNLHVVFRLDFVFVWSFWFTLLCVFNVSLDHFIPVLLAAFVVFGLLSSVPSQQIGWVEHLQDDLFCVERDVKL